ncbi:AbrB family transcriptional regulator [Sphingomonas sp. BIUV-7]|uniref:AbrB family transcriptional regulator n=1 Tax=Sphingomonas natans TaxID=3063330 RepID=A0ABT8Y6F2_9SPHN|nr:AbrB/MazE/SpoVT family DNA-binding domain-containing protein [Sphingomonas sp. BIUV-7]MDO6413902.1 AbrB family transcriptional regulator [Sphingomonas sp. BIUV-7]
MSDEYRAKVFKSGNSVAIRIPKSWGFQPGEELDIIAREDGSYEVRRAQADELTLDSLFGSFSPDFMSEGRGETDQADRDWSAAGRPPRAA